MTKSRISILDLTWEQTDEIERETGIPVDDWMTAPKAKLFRTIMMVYEGQPAAAYEGMTLGDLIDRVTFDEPEGKDEGGPA